LDLGKNQQTISELFVGLLRYYAYEFDYANNSICIHKSYCPKVIINFAQLTALILVRLLVWFGIEF